MLREPDPISFLESSSTSPREDVTAPLRSRVQTRVSSLSHISKSFSQLPLGPPLHHLTFSSQSPFFVTNESRPETIDDFLADLAGLFEDAAPAQDSDSHEPTTWPAQLLHPYPRKPSNYPSFIQYSER